MNIRRSIATAGAAGALAAGSLFLASPAQAQGPILTGGLVNVTIVDLADVNVEDVVVQLPLAIAANVCDTDINVLAEQLETGDANCTATSDSRANA